MKQARVTTSPPELGRLPYSSPSMAKMGAMVELTKGPGDSDKWDIGSGYKNA